MFGGNETSKMEDRLNTPEDENTQIGPVTRVMSFFTFSINETTCPSCFSQPKQFKILKIGIVFMILAALQGLLLNTPSFISQLW